MSDMLSNYEIRRYDSIAVLKTIDLKVNQVAETTSETGSWTSSNVVPSDGARYNVVDLAKYSAITGLGAADGVVDHPLDNGLIAMMDRDIVKSIENIVELKTYSALNLIYLKAYANEGDGGEGFYRWDATSLATEDEGLVVKSGSYVTGRWIRKYTGGINVKWFGSLGDDSTDNTASIQRAITAARSTRGKVIFPADSDGQAVYQHSSTLTIGASDLTLEGESTGVVLKYTGAGTAIIIDTTTQRERWSIKNLNLVSSTGAIGLDFTFGSYGTCSEFEIAYTAPNAKLIFAKGQQGLGPYFNDFSGFSLFGGDRSQTAISFEADTSGNFADGPNANVFSNCKRAASLNRVINIESGGGNLFSNFGCESIQDTMILLNNVPSLSDFGNATATGSLSLTDTTKSWSTVLGDPLNFTNGAVVIKSGPYAGEARRILSNTSNALTLDKAWPADVGSTPVYWIFHAKAVQNKFVNIRQEGLASDNPNCVRIIPGALSNEISQIDAGSLGAGALLEDQYGDPSNIVAQGELVVQTFTEFNPGPAASINVIPRVGVIGGLQVGSNIVLEYLHLSCPNYTAGEATVTVEQGGATVGSGSNQMIASINSYNTVSAFVANKNKVLVSSRDNPVHINLTTDGSVGANEDFQITLAYRVF